MKFTLKFTIEVYNKCLTCDEVLTQSYIREKLLPITWHFFLTFAWAERRFMLWWQQTHKSWPGLERICQWDDTGKFIIKIIIDSAELCSKSRINFRKTCGKFIGDFSINFHGKFTEDVFNFQCIIFCIKIIDDSNHMCRKFIRNFLFEI